MHIAADVKGEAILAWGRKSDHTSLAASIKQMQTGGNPEQKARLMIYPLSGGDPAAVTLMFKSLVPAARVAVDPRTGNLVVWATPQEHAAIKAAVEQMSGKEALAAAPTTGVYYIPGGGAAAVTQAFRVLFPQATFTANSPNQLVAVARPNVQRDIQKAVEQISAKDPPDRAPSAVSYALQTITAAAAMRVLALAFPDAKFALGNDPTKLVAFARPADQEAIKAAVAQCRPRNRRKPPRNWSSTSSRRPGSAPMRGQPPWASSPSCGRCSPMRSSPWCRSSRLMVWARVADHTAIQKAVDELTKKELPQTAPHVMTYTLPAANAAGVVPILHGDVPHRESPAGADPPRWLCCAAGRPRTDPECDQRNHQARAAGNRAHHGGLHDSHDRNRQRQGGRPDRRGVAASTALKTMFPAAQFTVGGDPTQLIVAARKADHAAIKAAVDELVKKESPDTAPRVVVYTLESANATAAVPTLAAMFPARSLPRGPAPARWWCWPGPRIMK